MLSKEKAIAKTKENISSEALQNACLKLLDFIYSAKPNQLEYITFNLITEVLGSEEFLFDVVSNFIRLNFLIHHMEVVIDDDILDIDEETIQYALMTDELYDPDTGEKILNFKNHIYFYFSVNNMGIE